MSKASVTINANSSQFQQEMKKCAQRMKELASESSLAAAQTKLFGSAQEQLKKKIENLEKQIRLQNDVVELNKSRAKELTDYLQTWQKKQASLQTEIEDTKKAIEESTQATGENSEETQKLKTRLADLQKEEKKAGEQVEACETKISKHKVATNKSEQALAELQVELKKTNQALRDAAWEKWEKGAEKAADTMTKAGKAMMPATTAVVGLGTAAMKTTADFDYQMSAVQAVAGATGDELVDLRDKALEMGSVTAFSASEAGQAMEFMAQAGWTTEDMLAGIEGVMNAAAASGEDLATTSSIVADGLVAFGLAASDSARFADVLAAAGNASNASVASMGETFGHAGAVCGTLGIAVEDAAIATGLMANAGIKGSRAGTALKSGLTNLVKPTEQMEAAMNKYGVSIQTTEDGSVDFMATMKNVRETLGGLDETTQAAAIAAIFGKEAMSGWAAVVNASEEDFQNLTNTIYNCEGAAQAAADVRMDNLSGQIETLKGTLETIAIQIGDILMPTIKKVVAKIQEWATAFANMDEGTKKTIVTIAGVVAAIGPVLVVAGKVVSVIGKIRKAFDALKKLKSVFTIFKTGFKLLAASAAGPVVAIAAVVAAIVGVIAYIKHLWDTNEDFRKAVTKIWENIKKTAKDVWNAIKKTIGDAIEKTQATVSNTIKKIEKATKDTWNNIKSTASSTWENIRATINTKIEGARSSVASVTEKIKTSMANAWNSAKSTASSIWENIRSSIAGKIESARSTVSSVISKIKDYMNFSWNLPALGTSILQSVKNAVYNAVSYIKGLFNFSWSLPKIKTPHFYISGYTNVLGASIPNIGVSWYKNGGIMTDPTMFGRYGNTAMVGGEAGPEAILPLEPFYTRLGEILDVKFAKLSEMGQTVVVYVTCMIDGEEITNRQIVKIEKHLAGTSRAIRRATT